MKKIASKRQKEGDRYVMLPGTNIRMAASLEPLLVPIAEVIPDPTNPRRAVNLDALKGSMVRFGVRKPIVVNAANNIIEAGHQTREVLLSLGATHVPVVWVDDDKLDATAYNIADNRTAEIVAEWDEQMLAKLLNDLKVEDALEGLGYTEDQVDNLIDSFNTGDENLFGLLPPPTIGGDGKGLSGRVVIVYETREEFDFLQERLGVELGNRITWPVCEIKE